jgi:hypothetical protein
MGTVDNAWQICLAMGATHFAVLPEMGKGGPKAAPLRVRAALSARLALPRLPRDASLKTTAASEWIFVRRFGLS